MSGNARVNLIIAGIVQGVFYRASTLEKAQSLNLTGWVRNRPDGSVEVVAEGSRYSLEALAEWSRLGPPSASVSDVTSRWLEFEGEFKTFVIS